MSQNLINLTSFLVLGLLISCSSGDGDPPSREVFVTANESDTLPGVNTDTGTVTDSTTGTATGGAGTATTTAGSETTGSATAAGTDGVATTTGVDTNGSTDSIGTTTLGTVTATAGTTAGSSTDAGLDSAGTAGTNAGATAGTTGGDTGTSAGTDTDGTGTTTSGSSVYEIGSLAYLIESEEQLSEALLALRVRTLDLEINEEDTVWTLFLPTNAALAAAGGVFDIPAHMYVGGALSADDLASLSGQRIVMNDNRQQLISGGVGTQPLTISNATITTEDIVGNTGSTVVHIIDAVIDENEQSTSPYPTGSMQDILFKRGDMMNVLSVFEEQGLNLAFSQPTLGWTIFLPTDNVLLDPADFSALPYIYVDALLDSDDLTGLSGTTLSMVGGNRVEIGGGGISPLTVNDVAIIESDVRNEAGNGPIAHIINVLLP